MPEISVVIAVKNRSAYLKEALESLKTQTLEDWECIVVDDHSEEDIAAVVEAAADPRFKYFRNPGSPGISSARNFGNRQASSEWLAVADSDDINLPRRLAATLQVIAENPGADVVHSAAYSVRDKTFAIKLWKWWGPYDREEIYARNMIAHFTSAYRRSLAMEFPYNEELSSAVDYDLWLSLADKHKAFVYIQEPLVLYRLHDGQITFHPELSKVQVENANSIRAAHAPFK